MSSPEQICPQNNVQRNSLLKGTSNSYLNTNYSWIMAWKRVDYFLLHSILYFSVIKVEVFRLYWLFYIYVFPPRTVPCCTCVSNRAFLGSTGSPKLPRTMLQWPTHWTESIRSNISSDWSLPACQFKHRMTFEICPRSHFTPYECPFISCFWRHCSALESQEFDFTVSCIRIMQHFKMKR